MLEKSLTLFVAQIKISLDMKYWTIWISRMRTNDTLIQVHIYISFVVLVQFIMSSFIKFTSIIILRQFQEGRSYKSKSFMTMSTEVINDLKKLCTKDLVVYLQTHCHTIMTYHQAILELYELWYLNHPCEALIGNL